MQIEKDLVSICIPTYNGSKYIRETLESVCTQSYKNLEIIITDDISSDNTEEIIRSIGDKRIRFFKNTSKKGLAGNWNEAVHMANGEYIKVLCQDDLLTKDAVQKQFDAMKNSGAACVIGNTDVIDSEGRRVISRNFFKKDKIVDGYAYARKSLIGRNIYSEPGNIMYRAELFYRHGEYDNSLKYTPDWEFAIRVSAGEKLCCIKDHVFSFRVSDNSETSRLYRTQMKELISDTDRMIEKLRRNGTVRISTAAVLCFKFNIRVMALARGIVLFLSGKK